MILEAEIAKKKYIKDAKVDNIIEIINGEKIVGKHLKHLHLIVKVNINTYDAELSNQDICEVLGETLEGKLVIQRLYDKHIGIINKERVSIPDWQPYSY